MTPYGQSMAYIELKVSGLTFLAIRAIVGAMSASTVARQTLCWLLFWALTSSLLAQGGGDMRENTDKPCILVLLPREILYRICSHLPGYSLVQLMATYDAFLELFYSSELRGLYCDGRGNLIQAPIRVDFENREALYLLTAAYFGSICTLERERLLGVSLGAMTTEGETALDLAWRSGGSFVVEYLGQFGAPSGTMGLHALPRGSIGLWVHRLKAFFEETRNRVQWAMEQLGVINEEEGQRCPFQKLLYWLEARVSLPFVGILLETPAKAVDLPPNSRGAPCTLEPSDFNLLCISIVHENLDVAHALIEAGATITEDAVFEAAACGNPSIMYLLIQRDAPLDIRRCRGEPSWLGIQETESPRDVACRHGHTALVNYIDHPGDFSNHLGSSRMLIFALWYLIPGSFFRQ